MAMPTGNFVPGQLLDLPTEESSWLLTILTSNLQWFNYLQTALDADTITFTSLLEISVNSVPLFLPEVQPNVVPIFRIRFQVHRMWWELDLGRMDPFHIVDLVLHGLQMN